MAEQPSRPETVDDPPPSPAADRPFIPPVRAPLADVAAEPEVEPSVEPADESSTLAPVEIAPQRPPVQSGDAWARVLRAQGLPTVLRAVLTNLTPVSVDLAAGQITLTGEARYADSARTRHAQIVDVCRRELGQSIDVLIQSDEPPTGEPAADGSDSTEATVAENNPQASSASSTQTAPAPSNTPPAVPSQHPLVKEAMELFGARIVDVQHRRPSV